MDYSISVIISTYGHRRFVERKLAEIRDQTLFRQCEFIFVETGSPEREREALAPFCRQHANCKLLVTDDRKSLYEAWNLGWDAAGAPLLCYSNMDDVMHPRLLEQVVRRMQQHAWDACSVLIAMQGEAAPRNDWSPARLRRLPLCLLPGPFTAWRNELKDSVGQFDGGFFVRGDKDFWSRILAHRLRIGLVKKILYLYTESAEQLSKSPAEKQRRKLDKDRLAAKPYPIRWPGKIRVQASIVHWMLRLWPGAFTLSAPEND